MSYSAMRPVATETGQGGLSTSLHGAYARVILRKIFSGCRNYIALGILCAYIYICTHVCMYAYIYMCMYVCMYVCMLCVYVYIYPYDT